MKRDQLFAWVVVAVTAGAFASSLVQRSGHPPGIGQFAFWIALVAAAELLPVSLGYESQITMGFPIHLAVAILYRSQPWVPMLIVGIGSIDTREIRGEIPLWRALFNRAQTMLSVGAAAAFFALFGGSVFNPGVVAGAAAINLLLNLGLVAVMVALHFGSGLRQSIRGLLPDPVRGFMVSYVLLTALGAVTARAGGRFGLWAVAAILIPLVFARLSIMGAKAQQDLSERVQKQQQELLQVAERVFLEREEERNRIAGDMHDSSLQFLAAASFGSDNALAFLRSGNVDKAQASVQAAHDAIDKAMAALRSSIVDLRASTIRGGGLMTTLATFADEVSTLWGTEVRIEGDVGKEPLMPVSLAAVQIVEEAITNSLKHSQSDEIVVRIGQDGGMVRVVVEDFGTGFDPEVTVEEDHVGMRLMRERASQVGGRISLESVPGSGTRLEAILPVGVAQ